VRECVRPPGEESFLQQILAVDSVHLPIEFFRQLSLTSVVLKHFPYLLEDDMLTVLLAERFQKVFPTILLLLQFDCCLLQFLSELNQLIANVLA
jgi:hypothetical protein